MTESDPRLLFSRALDQTEDQVRAVRTGDLARATPCSEYDVRALLGHIVAVLRKIAPAGGAGDVSDMPDGVSPDDDWDEAFKRARSEVEQMWADDAVLDRALTLPWARMPGRDVLDAYTHELTVHSWDLASATGRLSTLDPDLGASALAWFETAMPAGSRGGEDRFGSAVDAPEDADVYTRLAAHTGRSRILLRDFRLPGGATSSRPFIGRCGAAPANSAAGPLDVPSPQCRPSSLYARTCR